MAFSLSMIRPIMQARGMEPPSSKHSPALLSISFPLFHSLQSFMSLSDNFYIDVLTISYCLMRTSVQSCVFTTNTECNVVVINGATLDSTVVKNIKPERLAE